MTTFHFRLTQGASIFTKDYSALNVADAIGDLLRDLAIVASYSRAKGKKAPLSSRSPFQVVAFETLEGEVSNKVLDTTLSGNILIQGGENFTGARFVRSLNGMKRILRDIRLSQVSTSPEQLFAAIEADKLARASHKALPTS